MKTTLINSKGEFYSNLNNTPCTSNDVIFTNKTGRMIPISEASVNNLNKDKIKGCKLVEYHNHSNIIKEY